MRYALIKNGLVENIIVSDYTNAHMIKQSLDMDDAINVDLYQVNVGDVYENGFFLTAIDSKDENNIILIPKGTVIERQLSNEEKFSILELENRELKRKNDDLTIIVADMIGGAM